MRFAVLSAALIVCACGKAPATLQAVRALAAPNTAAPGDTVSLTALFSDDGRAMSAQARASRCPASRGNARDVDCAGEELVVATGVATRSGTALSFGFDYTVPLELPDGFTERVRIRVDRGTENAVIVASVAVAAPPAVDEPPFHPALVAADASETPLVDGMAVARGTYQVSAPELRAPIVFCTDGCEASFSPQLPPLPALPTVRFERGTPTLIVIGVDAGAQPVAGRFLVRVSD
jgi:hypothetical protein